jgi:hypothetical protein
MTTFKECTYPNCKCPRYGRCGNAEAAPIGPPDPRGPFFITAWEREDHERRRRGEPELGPGASSVSRPHLSTPEKPNG